ncbi:DUF1344 domain-containing protein [Daeguia caeni]|uniref:DUF1344 domain-containing protein n=1 Tax=Daeguia caeni TaxID=439612 RepID=A0ABV9H432_9HYPH
MRHIVGLILVIASLLTTAARADDAEGRITSINPDNETITLDDGKTYKLPHDFDYNVISKGMKVFIVYDLANDTRYVTDIEEAP